MDNNTIKKSSQIILLKNRNGSQSILATKEAANKLDQYHKDVELFSKYYNQIIPIFKEDTNK